MAKEHWGRAVLEEVANSGDIEIWTAVVDIFKTHGMLEEVCIAQVGHEQANAEVIMSFLNLLPTAGTMDLALILMPPGGNSFAGYVSSHNSNLGYSRS